MEIKPWKVLDSKTAFNNRFWNIMQETVELPDGSVYSEFFVNEHTGAAQVFALTEDGMVVMNRQYKHGTRVIETEHAIGALKAGEDPLLAAQRELLEETGYGEGEWESLGAHAPSPTASRSLFHAYIAKNVRLIAEPVSDPREVIETFLVDPKALPEMIARGEIRSLASISLAFLALTKLGLLETKS
ncbi:MAG: NUDIX hydrolase [Patescibacteria group bacterium]|nr:MAG: NUDIX hydrolase [Patescibacteria group bacterium]